MSLSSRSSLLKYYLAKFSNGSVDRHMTTRGRRITINRFSGGKIVEDWYQSDDLGMMQQLGVIPSEETSEEASPT
jgi:hypothetical protein